MLRRYSRFQRALKQLRGVRQEGLSRECADGGEPIQAISYSVITHWPNVRLKSAGMLRSAV